MEGGDVLLAISAPIVSKKLLARMGVTYESLAGKQIAGKKRALAKWFEDTCSFAPLWNADCTIFFVKQDSHWVEDKQLFIKRNQELLEKVCWAQHPSGAEEETLSNPGAAGGALRSGTGAREGEAFPVLLCALLSAQLHSCHHHHHRLSGMCAWLRVAPCADSKGSNPWNPLIR